MFSKEKMDQQISYFTAYRYSQLKSVESLQMWYDTRADQKNIPKEVQWEDTETGACWGGRDEYFWLKFDIQFPTIDPDQQYLLFFDIGRTGIGNNSGFEAQLYIDEFPYQAVDSNHQEVFFNDDFSNRLKTVFIKLWTGLEGGGPPVAQHYTLNMIEQGFLNQEVDDLIFYLINIEGTILELSDDDPLKYEYIELIENNLKNFYWADITEDTMIEQSKNFLNAIHQFTKRHANQKKGYNIAAVGHTHIDVAWLWRLKHTREKISRSFSTVLRLMEQHPEYLFFQSTPQDYEFLSEDYPQLFKQIQQKVIEKRWEPDGGMWVEPDTNIPSGESLTRQFLYGNEYFEKHFDEKQSVLWLPDVFGYSWALPQILAGFNIHNFMTTKISWNDTNRMPHDTFVWKGMDGTKVLTHFITTIDAQSDYYDSKNWMYTYNGEITPHTVLGTYHVYADKQLNNDLLLAYGYGDGGGGPTRTMLKNIEIINELPGLPTIKNTRVDDYFEKLNQRLINNRLKPSEWDGELYLEFHRGTYTSQARVKKENRQLEFLMRELEMNYVSGMIYENISYPDAEIKGIWKNILRNQFHDIIPGSSIHEVYEDNKKEYQRAFQQIQKLSDDLRHKTFKKADGGYTIVNSLAWNRSELVHIKRPEEEGYFVDEAGNILRSVKEDSEYVVVVPDIPALGSKRLEFRTGKSLKVYSVLSQLNSQKIESNYYLLEWNEAGQLTRLYDKTLRKELLAINGKGNYFEIYEDRPLEYDNWNIDGDYPNKKRTLKAEQIIIKKNNDLFTSVEMHYRFGKSAITQLITLYRDKRRIDFKTHIDWHEHQELLRVYFDTSVHSEEATYDIQYGNVKRQTNNNTSWEMAKFETVAHKWADLSERSYGIALLNDSKYGYSIKNNLLSLTLLKSGIFPDTSADEGEHDFVYSLLSHKGDFIEGMVEAKAWEINNPVKTVEGLKNEQEKCLFTFASEIPVVVDAIKKSENGSGVILRFHDYSGGSLNVRVKAQFDYQYSEWVNLNEEPLNKLAENETGEISLDLKPYQIITLHFHQ